MHYVEGCSAPIYTTDSLHSAVVEIVAKKGARVRYTTIQNWSTNVYNLVTKRAAAHEDAVMEWIDGNIGSKVTMKYPSIYLLGKGARGEVLSVAYAGKGMHTDAGGKAIHAAPYTTSVLTSKSVSKDGGRTGYRGLVRIEPGAHHAKSNVRCDALILDEASRSDTYPYVEVEEETAQLGHEASVSRIGEDQLFYLMSRGLSEAEASADDRERVHRARHARAPDGVRRRAQPPGRAPDGRRDRLAGSRQHLAGAGDYHRRMGPRTFGIIALHAPVVAVIRRGPSDWMHLSRWDLGDARVRARRLAPRHDLPAAMRPVSRRPVVLVLRAEGLGGVGSSARRTS